MTTAEPVAVLARPAPEHDAHGDRGSLPLLCETCGYDIDTLEREASACPECGRAIAESVPEARAGSPWQRHPSLLALVRTNYDAVRRPRALFSQLRIEHRRGLSLAVVNAVIAAALLVYPWSGVLIGDPLRRTRSVATALWAVPLQVLTVAALLIAMTAVEWIGIQLIARRRKWRLTASAALQVCAHASVGWIVMALTMWIALIIWLNATWFWPSLAGRYDIGLGIPAAGLLAGLVAFEVLVWVGARECRYGNPVRQNVPRNEA